jgi:hypothetical protein
MASTVVKSPNERYTLTFPYAGKLPTGTTLTSGELFASRLARTHLPRLLTVLVADALAGASTLTVAADPGRGAHLIVGTAPTQERVKVFALAGLVATIRPPVRYAHLAGEVIRFEPGRTTEILGSATANVTGTDASVILQAGVARELYRVGIIATLDNGNTLEDACRVYVRDD